MYQVLGALSIDTVKVGLVKTFRDTGGMYDVVELQASQLFGHLRL